MCGCIMQIPQFLMTTLTRACTSDPTGLPHRGDYNLIYKLAFQLSQLHYKATATRNVAAVTYYLTTVTPSAIYKRETTL